MDSYKETIEKLRECLNICINNILISDDSFNIYMDEINKDIIEFNNLTDDKIDEIIELYKIMMDKIDKCIYYLNNQKMNISYVD